MSCRDRYDDRLFALHYDASEADRIDAFDVRTYADAMAALAATSPLPVRILELGCGTGRLTLPVARRGLAVTAVDEAAAVIDLARAKAEQTVATPPIRFVVADACTLDLGETFDAAFMGYNTISMIGDERMDLLIAVLARHLPPGAPFHFDLRRGTALAYRDGPVREIPESQPLHLDLDGRPYTLTRRMRLHHHPDRHFVETTYFWRIVVGDELDAPDGTVDERKTVMTFSTREPEWYLDRFAAAGFVEVSRTIDPSPDGRDHVYLAVARRS